MIGKIDDIDDYCTIYDIPYCGDLCDNTWCISKIDIIDDKMYCYLVPLDSPELENIPYLHIKVNWKSDDPWVKKDFYLSPEKYVKGKICESVHFFDMDKFEMLDIMKHMTAKEANKLCSTGNGKVICMI